ncbi:hypothetical protein [Microbispora sp. H11081]|uniref:hypothetical protein n=1 Tax=Microbispora sp. H11081 TaxID=2729107 RepID=UPI0014730AA8|nr:hypothetical protein [Microbispora sp. H11081]
MRAGLTLVAVTMAAVALVASHPAAAGLAAVTGTAGDRNGNSTTVRLGNGMRNVSEMTVGSSRSRSGIQQRTVGVSGVANAQSTICGRESRSCHMRQRIRASDREIEMTGPAEERTRRAARRAAISPYRG